MVTCCAIALARQMVCQLVSKSDLLKEIFEVFLEGLLSLVVLSVRDCIIDSNKLKL
jgi:hypothetical protein